MPLKKNAAILSAMPSVGSVALIPHYLRKRGITVPARMDTFLNYSMVVLFNIIGIMVPVIRQPRLRGRWARISRAAGAPLLVLGSGIVSSAVRERKIIGVADPDHLVTTGAYKYMRHPNYAGQVAAFLGWSLVLGAPYAAAAVPILTVYAEAQASWEEKEQLVPIFGEEYAKYGEETPMLLPWFLVLALLTAYVFALVSLGKAQSLEE